MSCEVHIKMNRLEYKCLQKTRSMLIKNIYSRCCWNVDYDYRIQVLEKNDRFASLISSELKNCTPSQVWEKVQVIYVLPLLQARIQNRCECWFESIQTSFYPTIWAFYWVSFSIQFVNSLKSLQPAWRASAFSEQILFWRISPFQISRYLHIILINIFKYSIGQVHSYRVWYPKKFKCSINCFVVRFLLHGDIANTSVDSKQSR